jgi:hypothetical protein
MFSKTFFISALVVLLSAQVNAHAIINPALGVTGKAARANVQRPKAGAECGKANIAGGIDAANAVAVGAGGSFSVTAQNFNNGKDGSRQVTMSVDATGTGKKFVAGTVSKNGDLAPTAVATQDITAALPAGTKCTGGKAGNRCLVAFKTAGGFGNCVVVSQGAAAAGGAAAGGAAAGGAAAGGKGAGGKKGKGARNVAGTRAPRAFLAELGSEAAVVKRSVLGWFWA